jgi:hypothetical protein
VGGQVGANGTVTIPNVWPVTIATAVGFHPPYVKSIRLGQLDLIADVLRIPTQVTGQSKL